MSKWAGKYIIGLTGNIGTGKSVVRKMLEHLGAYGIDADTLGHRAIARGAPGYQSVIEAFGKWILTPEGEVDRTKIARIVFNDPTALTVLEKIVHPLVEQAIDLMVQRSSQSVIVVEAIKLLETNLHRYCDSIWVTYAPPELQMARLVHSRHMTESEARSRMANQPSAERKMAAAQVVIMNVGSFEETWRQVVTAWQKVAPSTDLGPASLVKPTATAGEINVLRGKPRNSDEIAQLINRIRRNVKPLTKDDIMAAFGEKAYLLLQVGAATVGVMGWQVENLVARTTDIVIDPKMPLDKALPPMVTEMEKTSKELQCEASLIFVAPEFSKQDALWRSMGYEQRSPHQLGVMAWQEAAAESMPPETILYFKQLRQDRILRPI